MDRYSLSTNHCDKLNESEIINEDEDGEEIPENIRNYDLDGDDNEESPVVEITLQCLGGIHCLQRSSVTAQVSFSGSAKDMQVGSSMLCGRTGQLVVESQPSLVGYDEQGIVHWTRTSKRKPAAQPHLTIRLPPNQDPRVNISLSKVNRDSRLVVKKDYETDDDDCDLNAVPSLQDESEDSDSTRSNEAPTKDRVGGAAENTPDDGTVRGGSIIWSASGACMPEIVELHVTLLAEGEGSNDDDEFDSSSATTRILSSQQQGIAHLVLYGNDYGTFVLDLPVKKQYMPSSTKPPSPPPSPLSSVVWMDSDAFIRVQVAVYGPGCQRRQEVKSAMTRSSGTWVINNNYDRWTAIVRQLQENEEQARRLRLQKLHPQISQDVREDDLGHDENDKHQNDGREDQKTHIIWEEGPDYGIPRFFKSHAPSSRLFCPTANSHYHGDEDRGFGVGGGSAARWMDAVVESFSRVASCQYPKQTPFPTMIVSRHRPKTTTNTTKTRRSTALGTSSDYDWSIPETETMVSTIATRDSLNI